MVSEYQYCVCVVAFTAQQILYTPPRKLVSFETAIDKPSCTYELS